MTTTFHDSYARTHEYIRTLASRGPEALQILGGLAQDHEDWYVRGEAAAALGHLGGGQAVRLLEALAQDTDEYVRMAVAEALTRIGGPEALKVLEALAQDTDEYVRMAAAEALDQAGRPTTSLGRRPRP